MLQVVAAFLAGCTEAALTPLERIQTLLLGQTNDKPTVKYSMCTTCLTFCGLQLATKKWGEGGGETVVQPTHPLGPFSMVLVAHLL